MSPIRSRHSALGVIAGVGLAAVAGCQSSKKADDVKTTAAPRADARPAPAIAGCRAAADRFANDPGQGAALIAGCAPLFTDASCRGALEAAARTPGATSGMAAVVACKTAYCPKHSLAELCESKAPPTSRVAKAQFPRLAAEVLEAEHGEALGTLDSVAYLMIKPLLPPERQVYIRARASGDAVTLAVGESGWAGCKTDKTLAIARSADLRALDGPLLGPLSEVAKGVDPALVEVLVDPAPGARVLEVATAAGRFLANRGMDMVICRNRRANCPDVARCP